jgi:hypothetical protein
LRGPAVLLVLLLSSAAAGAGPDSPRPNPGVTTVYASPIHAGCRTAGASTCVITVEPFSIQMSPGIALSRFQIWVDSSVVYDFRPDVSNPPLGPSYTPSQVALGFSVLCASARTVHLVGSTADNPSLFLLGSTGPIDCPTPPGNMLFYPVEPCRLYDTRIASGTDAGAPALATGETRTIVPAERCGVPSTAGALSLNVAVVTPTKAGHLTIFPADVTLPAASSINFTPGRNRSNNALVRLAVDATGFRVFNGSFGTVDLVLDVSGYFQ